MKKVLLNLLAAKTGGQVTRVNSFLKIAETRDDGIHFLALISPKSNFKLIPSSKISIVSVDIGSGYLGTIKRFVWENTMMYGIFKEHSCDLYLSFSHYLPHFNFKDIPSVIGISNLAPFSKKAIMEEKLVIRIKLFILKKLIISSMQRAKAIISLSATCTDILSDNGIEKNKITTIRNGVDKFWAEKNNQNFIDQDYGFGKFILYVSHFYRYKNHIRLLMAYNLVKNEIDENINLILIGNPSNANYFNEIKAFISDNKMEKNVFLLESQSKDKLKDFYHNSYMVVFPSLIENSPNVLLESMIAGKPIASSIYEPMVEHCNDAAIYFDPLDERDMANVMIKIITDKKLQERISNLAAIRGNEHNWDYFYNECVKLIHKSL